MILLVMIALAMLSLSTIELRASRQGEAMAEAQSNARMALMIAVGELQKNAGADQRVTAEASILEDPDGGTPLANRHWVGVWRSDALKNAPATGATPIIHRNTASSGPDAGSLMDQRADESYDAGAQVLTWLVSRIDNATTIDPTTVLADKDSTLLVGSGSAMEPENQVRAGKVAVMTNGVKTGSYAWWAGDEGVKSRFDLADATSGLAKIQPWISPAQSGINIVEGYEKYETVDAGDIAKVSTRHSSDISGAATSPAAAKNARLKNFHDLTFSSTGLLTDTLRGGLRRDLSVFLANGSAPKLGTRKGLNASDPILDSNKLKDLSAKFGLLHHWNNLGKNLGSSGGVDPVPPKSLAKGTDWRWNGINTEQNAASGIDLAKQDTAPIHPIMIDVGISYGLSFTELNGASAGETRVRLNLHYFPRVVLYNPYNVKINAAKYALQINMPHSFRVELKIPGSTPINIPFFQGLHYRYVGENLPHRPHFSIPATSFEPGEALVFTADGSGANHGNKYWGHPDSAASRDINNFALSCTQTPPLTSSFYMLTETVLNIPTTKLPHIAYQVFAKQNGLGNGGDNWKFFFYKLYLNKGKGGSTEDIRFNPSTYPPLQFISQTENGSPGTDAPWFDGIPASATTPVRELKNGPAQAFYRFKWGHRMQWFDETAENQTVAPGFYNTPFLGYNTIANHNIRAGWHVRSPVEVAYRATNSGGRYVHGVLIDDPYGWDWQDSTLFPVPVGGKNRVSPFGRPADYGGQTFPMLDLPSKDAPLLSLAALQHAPLSQFPWHPTNAVGNSLADPRVHRNRSTNFASSSNWNTIGFHSQKNWITMKQAHANSGLHNAAFLHDLSYETNFALWDKYFLSSVDSSYSLGDELDNPRLILSGDGEQPKLTDLKDFHQAAKHLMIKGAFNVNSTSERAWAALIASFRSNPDMKITLQDGSSINGNDIYSRFLKPYKKKYTGGDAHDEETWTGHRQLSDDQINELAQEIVKEVKQRGPFISLADFVNRRLVDPPKTSGSETEHSRTGLKGTLQAAIDRTDINKEHRSNHQIQKTEYDMGGAGQVNYGNSYPELTFPVNGGNSNFGPKPDHNHWADSKLVGTPSYLTQADMLQKFGSVLSARSDTFVIRTYGESVDSKGKVLARAWCEAIVQRTQTPMLAGDQGLDPHSDITANPTAAFGRKFKVISFRWLNKEEV